MYVYLYGVPFTYSLQQIEKPNDVFLASHILRMLQQITHAGGFRRGVFTNSNYECVEYPLP